MVVFGWEGCRSIIDWAASTSRLRPRSPRPQLAISSQQSAVSNQQSAISSQQSAVSNQQSAISSQQLAHLSQLAGSAARGTAPGLHRGQKVCTTRAMLVCSRATFRHTQSAWRWRWQMRSRPTIVAINLAQGSDWVCTTGTLEHLFLYLSASGDDW